MYKQSIYTTNQENFNNEFRLECKYTEIPNDVLLFFVPSVSSNNNVNSLCKLIISVPKKLSESDSDYTYIDESYDIVVEQNDGTTRPASKGDIIAFRMCIFRFRKTSNQVILCNSPLYNSVVLSNAKITNCEFVNLPTIKDPDNAALTYTLVSSKELAALTNRIESLENKIIFGTEDPEDILSDKPTGTIYIRHEED